MALNIVLSGALPGGGPQSLRVDNLAKTMASALLRMRIDWSVAADPLTRIRIAAATNRWRHC